MINISAPKKYKKLIDIVIINRITELSPTARINSSLARELRPDGAEATVRYVPRGYAHASRGDRCAALKRCASQTDSGLLISPTLPNAV
jgi:hypothetical protein